MTEDFESELTAKPRGKKFRRRGDGGIYLVVADNTEEFGGVLRYAAQRAEVGRAHVGILQITSVDDFQHWSNVEAMMRRELRAEAEKKIWAVAKAVNDINGMYPVLYIAEGEKMDVIIETINGDENIRMLILGAGTSAAGPGPLVQYFTGKGLARLRVPVLVVPGHIPLDKIDNIAL